MASRTIICKGIEGDTQEKSFGVDLDTDTRTWRANGPHVSLFMNTRSGPYKIAGVPENGTQLAKAGPAEVAFLKGLNGASTAGDTGTGRASEKGVNFQWKLDSK